MIHTFTARAAALLCGALLTAGAALAAVPVAPAAPMVAASAPAMAPAAATPMADAKPSAAAGPRSGGCAYGPSRSGRAGCMAKAEFELTRARQAALDRDPAQYQRNAQVRCEGLSEEDKRLCVARMQGQGTTTGSVEGGGIYRELITREPAAAGVTRP